LKETGANRSWVSGEHRPADRGFEGNKRGQVAGFWTADVVGSQRRGSKARLGRRKMADSGGQTAENRLISRVRIARNRLETIGTALEKF